MTDVDGVGVIRGPGDFGFILRYLRERESLTRAELAAKAGVSVRWLANVEAGKPSADVSKILDSYKALGYSFSVVHYPVGNSHG
jgi:transcriptional regulator with XRE-family HTH domain